MGDLWPPDGDGVVSESVLFPDIREFDELHEDIDVGL
jgi:hypothetical protein